MYKQMDSLWSGGAVALFCVLMVMATACTETTTDEAPAEGEQTQGRFALLTMTADTGHSPRVGDEIEVTGQFVTYDGPSADWAMRALDLWIPEGDRSLWRDRCRLMLDPPKEHGVGGASTTHIELVEAGYVELSSHHQSTLELHHVPDLMDYFSGVVYRLGPNHGFAYVPEQAYRFSGSGSADVGPFDVMLHAPEAMELTSVAEQPRDNSLDVKVPEEGDFAIEWIAQDPETKVYFDVYHDDLSPAPLLSCTADDDGRFDLPEDALIALRAHYPEASFRMVVRRAELVDFIVEGVDWARAAFITSDVIFLTP